MDVLNESERRFTKKLCDAMIPVMIEAFWEIWLEAKKESQGRNTVQVFQKLLQGVKTWNSDISLRNSEAITKNDSLFPNLLAAVFVIQVKILSSIRTDKKSKKICIKLPAVDVFTQRCFVECAKELYESPSIIVDNRSDNERNDELYRKFSIKIHEVIEKMVPTAEILNTYLPLPAAGEDISLDHDDEDAPLEDEDEEIPDIDESEMSELPQNSGNMEFGKTPSGSNTMVTTTATLTPPSVPEPSSGEDLFPDAPATKVQKLP
jgi:hypothetical protein